MTPHSWRNVTPSWLQCRRCGADGMRMDGAVMRILPTNAERPSWMMPGHVPEDCDEEVLKHVMGS